MEIRGRK